MLKRFDRNTDKHYHIKCVRCGKISDVPLPPLGGLEDDVQEGTQYLVLDYCLEFSGICPDCLQRENPSETSRNHG